MTRAWRAWVELWSREEPATAQALVRIALGLCILGDLLDVWRLGLVDVVWAPPPEGMGHGASEARWAIRWLGADAGTAHLLFWTAALSSAAFTAGALTRVAGVVLVLVLAQLAYLTPEGDRGIDAAMRVVVLVLVFSSCHARWSVDAWLRARLGRPFPALVPAWPRLLLFAQLVWIYFSGGHNKVTPEWNPLGGFSALAHVMSDPHFARFSSDWVSSIYPLTQLATAATMIFEVGAPAMLYLTWRDDRRWCRRLRWAWIAVGVGFHVGIAIFLRLGVFPWAMLALYPVLFRADELAAAGAWLRRRPATASRAGTPPASGRSTSGTRG